MAKFCNKCGEPLVEGQHHFCAVDTDQQGYGGGFQQNSYDSGRQSGGYAQDDYTSQGTYGDDRNSYGGGYDGGYAPQGAYGIRGLLIGMMNRMGIGDPTSNSDGIYERDKMIAPDILPLNEGEVPVRQYNVAVLRSRSKFMRSEGRMEVTNKRLLFRATGRSPRGKISLQHEFSLADVKGLEIRQDYSFSLLNLILAILLTVLGCVIGAGIVTWMYSKEWMFMGSLVGLLLGAGALFCFFALFRKFHLKAFLLGIGMLSSIEAFAGAKMYIEFARYMNEGAFGLKLLVPFLCVAMVLCVITLIVGLLLASMNPNLVIDIKTEGGGAPIQIRRKSILEHCEYTGFDEVMPAAEAELAVREINAMINDIQNTGDRAIRRWQN